MGKSKLSGETQNILYHPAFGCRPVVNRKIRGPKKGAISFRSAYRKRLLEQLKTESPKPDAVKFPKQIKGKFKYPSSCLMQAYFCRSGNGERRNKQLSLCMLVDSKFISPLGALLSQLAAEGHDVGGAPLEYQVFRAIGADIEKDVMDITFDLSQLIRRNRIWTGELPNKDPAAQSALQSPAGTGSQHSRPPRGGLFVVSQLQRVCRSAQR